MDSWERVQPSWDTAEPSPPPPPCPQGSALPGTPRRGTARQNGGCPGGPGLAGTVYWQPRYRELGYVRARKRQCKAPAPGSAAMAGMGHRVRREVALWHQRGRPGLFPPAAVHAGGSVRDIPSPRRTSLPSRGCPGFARPLLSPWRRRDVIPAPNRNLLPAKAQKPRSPNAGGSSPSAELSPEWAPWAARPGWRGSPVVQITWKKLINKRRVLGKGAAGVPAAEEPARGAGPRARRRRRGGNTVLTDFTKKKKIIIRVITKHGHEAAADDTGRKRHH